MIHISIKFEDFRLNGSQVLDQNPFLFQRKCENKLKKNCQDSLADCDQYSYTTIPMLTVTNIPTKSMKVILKSFSFLFEAVLPIGF